MWFRKELLKKPALFLYNVIKSFIHKLTVLPWKSIPGKVVSFYGKIIFKVKKVTFPVKRAAQGVLLLVKRMARGIQPLAKRMVHGALPLIKRMAQGVLLLVKRAAQGIQPLAERMVRGALLLVKRAAQGIQPLAKRMVHGALPLIKRMAQGILLLVKRMAQGIPLLAKRAWPAVKAILPPLVAGALVFAALNGSGLIRAMIDDLVPVTGFVPAALLLLVISLIPVVSPLVGPGVIIAVLAVILTGEQIASGAVTPLMALPAFCALDVLVGGKIIPRAFAMGETEPETINAGVPVVFFTRLITIPAAVAVAYLFSFILYQS